MKYFELVISDEMEMLMRAIAQGSTRPITAEEIFKRWIAKGLAFDACRPEEQGAQMVNQFVRLHRK